MENIEKIYYVLAIGLKKINEDDLKKLYNEHKSKNCKEISFERFVEIKKSLKEDRYSFFSFISSFHIEKEIAMNYVTNNIGDINEAGCYGYAAMVCAPINCCYFNSEIDITKDIILYKYNYEKNIYEELNNNVEEYNYLLSYVWGFV